MTLIAESVPEDTPLADVGSLRRVALPEILKRITLNELSGTLEARASGVVRTLYFDRGFLVFTASTAKKDRLGQRILKTGRLTPEQLETAARYMTDNRRIGQAIVAAGLLSEEELGRELVRQARRIATSMYALQVGLYRFTEAKCPIPMEFRLSLSMYRLQLEGIRQMRNKKLIVAALPRPERLVRANKSVPFSFEGLRFEPIELLVMEAAQKERPILEIVQRVSGGSDDVFRALYGLLCARILEGADAQPHAVPFKVQEETGTFLLSRGHVGADVMAENVRQEVLLEFERAQHASAEELLDVNAQTSHEEVRKKFGELRAAWDRKQWELDDDDFLFKKVDEIQHRLERAKDQILLGKAPEDSSDVDAKGAAAEASSEEVNRLLLEMRRRRDTLQRSLETARDEGLDAAGPDVSQSPSKVDEAEARRLLDQIRRRTEALKRGLERARSETPEPQPGGEGERAPAETEAETETERRAKIEDLLRQIEVRRATGDHEGVISIYYEIVRLEPYDARYEALLAEALASHPVFVRKAERHFRHAISLDPQNSELHYSLGRYYQTLSLNKRAVVELRAALRINPKLSKARVALSELGDDAFSPR